MDKTLKTKTKGQTCWGGLSRGGGMAFLSHPLGGAEEEQHQEHHLRWISNWQVWRFWYTMKYWHLLKSWSGSNTNNNRLITIIFQCAPHSKMNKVNEWMNEWVLNLTLHRSAGLRGSSPVVFLLLAPVVTDGGVLLPPGASHADVFHWTLGKVCVASYVLIPFERSGKPKAQFRHGTFRHFHTLTLCFPFHFLLILIHESHKSSATRPNTWIQSRPFKGMFS